jgi:hypothetical protein
MFVVNLRQLLFVFLVLGWSRAHAGEVFDINSKSVRALGMGNAYISMVQDADALFYNPAGLARIGGINWTVVDIVAGLSGLEVVQSVQDVQSQNGFTDTIRELYGENIFVGTHAKTAVTLPFISAAYYNSADVGLAVHDPAIPEIDVNFINDTGYALGFGAAVLPMMHLGLVAKRITRIGSRSTFGASYIGELDPEGIISDLEATGTGYSLDLGFNVVVPGPISPAIGFVWRNVGGVKFNPANTGDPAPPRDQDEMAFGASINLDALLVEVTPSIDFRYLNRTEVDLTKKINFGVELDLPLLDLRAGFHQGYLSYGAGLGLGLLRVDLASYGVELGEKAGQKEDRRYMLQATLELGFDLGLNFTGGGSGGSGRSKSGGLFGSSQRLKQRR